MFGKIIRGYLNLETCCSKNERKSCHPLSPIYLLPVLIPIGFFYPLRLRYCEPNNPNLC